MTNDHWQILDIFVRIFLLAGIAWTIYVIALNAYLEQQFKKQKREFLKKVTPRSEPLYVSTCKACSFTFSGTDRAKVWSEYASHYGKSHQ